MELVEHNHKATKTCLGQDPTPDRTLSNMAMRWLWAFSVMLISGLAACSPTQAHPEGETLPPTMTISEMVAVTAGEAMPLDVAPGGAYVSYEGEGPIEITVTPLEDSDPPLDVVITVLDNDWQQVTYHDGNSSGEETIARLDLADGGPYIIWVNSFNGLQTGQVDIEVTRITVPVLAAGDDPLLVDLFAGNVARVMLANMDEGPYRITVRSLTDERDVRLVVVDAAGTVIADNDDHEGQETDLGPLDAALVFEPDAGGPWTLEIREYLGRSATVEVSAATFEPDTSDQDRSD